MRLASRLVLGLSLLAMLGCGSIVKKPEIDKVKKVAIVSLYANEKIPEAKGRGYSKNWGSKFRMQVAEMSLRVYKKELKRLGWKVVSEEKVTQSKAYQDAFKVKGVAENSTLGRVVAFAQQAHSRSFFTPAGMHPIQLDDKQANTTYYGDNSNDPKKKLGEMAKELGVDAVLLVQVDYCYQGGTYSMLGTGEAEMTAGTSIKAINQNGELVVNMPGLDTCGGEDRATSASTTAMIKGNLFLKKTNQKKLKKMLHEATAGSAKTAVSQIEKAMQG